MHLPRWKSALIVLLVGALVAGCIGTEESVQDTNETRGNETHTGTPTLPTLRDEDRTQTNTTNSTPPEGPI